MLLFMISLFWLPISILFMMNNKFIFLEIPFISMFSSNMQMGFLLDWMSCMFMSTVMFISSMIILFSDFYIPKNQMKMFYILLMMFILSMSTLIISNNIIFILLGWDGLGLSSYLLVVFYQNSMASASGTITILSNRLGDIMIISSIALMMNLMNWDFSMNFEYSKISLILLMIAALSKSAQFPFSAWLPAAMAAPTPISALVHSSTLVTAGVYLMIRLMNFPHKMCNSLLMILSTATIIYASLSAIWEQDLKKIIAFSTLSQIAMMMFVISLNSPTLAFFHLITHALFKSTMFLCAGIMIHNSNYQDMRMMGMNMFSSPLNNSILSISNSALMGLPFLSGFFSKDSIIDFMMASNLNTMIIMMMTFSLSLTSSYSLRMMFQSNNFINKSNPNLFINFNSHAFKPILFMSSMSIMSGAIILWMIAPDQLFITPPIMKTSIIISIALGIMTGFSLYFKSKLFKKFGEASISIWFTHFVTSSLFPMFSKKMNQTILFDSSWQEMYGPQKLFSISIHSSIITSSIISSLMMSLMLMSLMMIML